MHETIKFYTRQYFLLYIPKSMQIIFKKQFLVLTILYRYRYVNTSIRPRCHNESSQPIPISNTPYKTRCHYYNFFPPKLTSSSQKPFSHLALPTQSPEELIRLKFGLLVRDHARHLKDEPRFGLLVDTHGIKGQHTRESRRIIHRMHCNQPLSHERAITRNAECQQKKETTN